MPIFWNYLSRKKEKGLKQLESQRIEEIVENVEAFYNKAKAFGAIKKLKDKGHENKVVINDENDECIHEAEKAAEKMRNILKISSLLKQLNPSPRWKFLQDR